MPISPDIESFRKIFDAGEAQLVWDDIAVDTQTPVSALLKLACISPYHLLYESVEGGRRARYSIIALDPDLIWRCVGGKAEINNNPSDDQDTFSQDGDDIFASLRKTLKQAQLNIPKELPPMAAGIFGYMGYDMVHYMEKLPSTNPDGLAIPESVYFRPKIIVIFDSSQDKAFIITPARPEEGQGGDAKAAYEAAKNRIEEIKQKLKTETTIQKQTQGEVGPFTPHTDESEYNEIVKKARDYVFAGDVCQVVPSRRWEGPFGLPPICLYRSLRSLNPSPYLFYINLGDFALVGSSPEILVRLDDGKVTIRPIAGTRKRGSSKEEDNKLEEELLQDEKELAEHLMLLDLGRNDVGRVAKPGTVKVTERMVVEKYSHVMHIVSNVEGEIEEGKDAIDALIAGFPAGTLTGAPKIRAMQIIDELEKEKRGFYGGTVGYFSASGTMDTCIAIRTGLVKDNKLYIQAGGGIVADSKERDEFLETENKAKAIIKAAECAEEFI